MAQIPQTPESKKAEIARQSIKWLTGKVASLQKNKSFPGSINARNYTNDKLFGMGDVFLFHYDPKWKAKLPYYDTFPLIIPIERYDNGFLGLNLHYLPPNIRRSFLNKLIIMTSTQNDPNTRMRISYDILKGAKHFNAYIPCVHRYLSSHVQGRMMKIFPHEWPFVIELPIEAFVKATKEQVWRDSRKKIRRA